MFCPEGAQTFALYIKRNDSEWFVFHVSTVFSTAILFCLFYLCYSFLLVLYGLQRFEHFRDEGLNNR